MLYQLINTLFNRIAVGQKKGQFAPSLSETDRQALMDYTHDAKFDLLFVRLRAQSFLNDLPC